MTNTEHHQQTSVVVRASVCARDFGINAYG